MRGLILVMIFLGGCTTVTPLGPNEYVIDSNATQSASKARLIRLAQKHCSGMDRDVSVTRFETNAVIFKCE